MIVWHALCQESKAVPRRSKAKKVLKPMKSQKAKVVLPKQKSKRCRNPRVRMMTVFRPLKMGKASVGFACQNPMYIISG